jgi:hypothetical protein
MTFNEAISFVYGLREMVDALPLASGLARRVLGGRQMMTSGAEIEREQALVRRTATMLSVAVSEDAFETITLRLGQVHDLRGTLLRLSSRHTLDDVELFEIKVFAMTAQAIGTLACEAGIDVVEVPDTSPVVALLDPEATGIPHFAIRDTWSPDLAAVRGRLRHRATPELVAENERLEDEVRDRLSVGLSALAPLLERTSDALARLDILIAKARQALTLGLCRPLVAEGETRYEGLFNPMVREVLRAAGRDFQPVDIAFGAGPTAITGANMGGKTVLLRSVALAQVLFQFGFHVPAREAHIVPVGEILISADAAQDKPGLSSFAAEMVCLDAIIGRVRDGARALVLIDEPARTTNPAEGGALVDALLDLLADLGTRALVTTHYAVRADVKRLKVKGLSDDGATMDYSLTPDDGRTPREALRMARILGVDSDLIARAIKYLSI